MKKKIEWLSILQGWSMLLVVIGHITLTNTFRDPQYPIAACVERIVYSFHMPLFMFISGFLFHWTKIRKKTRFSIVIREKLMRLGIPFLFFTIMAVLPKLLFAPLMKRPVSLDWSYFFDVFVMFKTNPLGEMWFIVTLFILMLLYPCYRWLLNNKVTIAMGTMIMLFVYWINPHTIQFFQLSNVMKMGFFFWCGILCSHYQWIRYLDSMKIFVPIVGMFMVAEYLEWYPLVLNMMGIVLSLSLSLQISRIKPSLFSGFRDYTYQIFLMGIFFQMAVRYVFMAMNNDAMYIPLYICSIVVGICGPVWITKGIKSMNNTYLNLCFGIN